MSEYWNILEFGRVPAKAGIRASIEKVSGPIQKNGRMSVSTTKVLNPGDYLQKVESARVPKNCPDQYRKMVDSV